MEWLIVVPLALQALLMLVDEFYFHYRRGLPKWERIGHPLDTLTVLAPVAFLIFARPTLRNTLVYAAMAIFSSVFVTKDEFVHAEVCEPAEHWLHAMLFIVHPVSFLVLAALWPVFHLQAALLPDPVRWTATFTAYKLLLPAQAAVLLLYALYQSVYWNLIWHPLDDKSITRSTIA